MLPTGKGKSNLIAGNLFAGYPIIAFFLLTDQTQISLWKNSCSKVRCIFAFFPGKRVYYAFESPILK
jgi:hypothetical protein